MALDDILVTVTADISGYTKSLEQAASATQQFQSSVQGTASVVGQQNSAMQKQGQAASETETRMGRLEQRNEAVAESGMWMAGILGSVAAGISTALGGVIMEAASFEDAFVGVEKTVGGTTQEMSMISDEIRQMATEMPRSAVEIAGVAEEAGRLGIEANSISDFTKTMVMMGDASDMSASKAATSMARFMNIMGTSHDDVERLGSAITDMGNNTAASESEILDLSMRLAGASNQIGLSETDVVGLAGTMTELGIRSEAGGTAMQKTFLKMNTAVMEGGDELDKFAEIAGMSSAEFKQAFEEDASEAIVAFIAGLDEVNESGGDVSSTLADVGLNNERTMDTLLRLSSSHEELAANMDRSSTAWDEGTALAQEAERVYGTLSSKLKKLWNRFKEIILIIGTPFLNTLSNLLNHFTPFISGLEAIAAGFDKLPDSIQGTLTVLGLFLPAVLGIGAAVMTINSVKIAFTGLEVVLGRLGYSVTALFGPAGLWLVGIAAALGALVYFTGKIKEHSDAQNNLKNRVKDLADSADETIEKTRESADAYADEKKEIDNSIKSRIDLKNEVVKLADQEDKSSADKARLKSKIEELNKSNEDLNLTYSEQKDALNMSNGELERKIRLSNKKEKLASTQERLNELLEEENELGMELGQVTAERNSLNNAIDDGSVRTAEYMERVSELEEIEEDLKDEIIDVSEARRRAADIVEQTEKEIENAVTEGVKTQTLSMEEVRDMSEDLADHLEESYGRAHDAATDFFDGISDEATSSFDDMMSTLDDNIKAMESWSENMSYLGELGATGLMEKFEDLGPEHAADLQEVRDAGEEGIMEMEEKYGEASEVAADKFLEPYKDELPGDVYDALVKAVQEGEKGLVEAIEEAELEKHGEDFSDQFRKGIEYNDGEIKATAQSLVNTDLLLPLQVAMDEADFEGEGSKAPKGVGTGVNNGGGGLNETTKGMLMNNVMSPISNKLTDGTFSPFGQSIPDGTASGIDSKSHGPEASVSDMVDGTLTASTSGFGISGGSSSKFQSDGTATMTGLESGISSKHGSVIGALSNVTTDLVSTSDTGMSDVEGSFSGGVNLIDAAMSVLPGNVGGHMTSMLGSLQTGGGQQETYMSTLSGNLPSPFSGLGSILSGHGSSAMSGLLRGLTSMTGTLMAKARGIASGISGAIGKALKIKSPSRVMMDMGENVGKGLEIGMDSTISDLDKMAILMAKASTPVQPEVDTGMMNRNRAKAQQAVSGKMAIKSAFEKSGMDKAQDKQRQALEQTMMRALQSQPDTVINMDGKMVGQLTEQHITSQQNRKSNRIRRR